VFVLFFLYARIFFSLIFLGYFLNHFQPPLRSMLILKIFELRKVIMDSVLNIRMQSLARVHSHPSVIYRFQRSPIARMLQFRVWHMKNLRRQPHFLQFIPIFQVLDTWCGFLLCTSFLIKQNERLWLLTLFSPQERQYQVLLGSLQDRSIFKFMLCTSSLLNILVGILIIWPSVLINTFRNGVDPSKSKSDVLKLQAIVEILVTRSLLKQESFVIRGKISTVQRNLEKITEMFYEMRQRIATLVEQNWNLQAELTETVPKSKYHALKSLYDDAEKKAKAIARSKQIEVVALQDQLIVSQKNINQLSSAILVRWSTANFF
jgi:hypothetical protein